MTESEDRIVAELKEIKELLAKIAASLEEVNQSVKGVSEDILGWTAYPYIEEVRSMPE